MLNMKYRSTRARRFRGNPRNNTEGGIKNERSRDRKIFGS